MRRRRRRRKRRKEEEYLVNSTNSAALRYAVLSICHYFVSLQLRKTQHPILRHFNVLCSLLRPTDQVSRPSNAARQDFLCFELCIFRQKNERQKIMYEIPASAYFLRI